MKITILVYISMLFSILILCSFMCCDAGGPQPVPDVHGSWDYISFQTTRTDSSTHPFTSVFLADTTYAPQTHNGFNFKHNDSVVYTDYTTTPNLVKEGTYQLIDTGYSEAHGKIVLFFPHAGTDTLNFANDGNSLQIITEMDSPHICDRSIAFYIH